MIYALIIFIVFSIIGWGLYLFAQSDCRVSEEEYDELLNDYCKLSTRADEIAAQRDRATTDLGQALHNFEIERSARLSADRALFAANTKLAILEDRK